MVGWHISQILVSDTKGLLCIVHKGSWVMNSILDSKKNQNNHTGTGKSFCFPAQSPPDMQVFIGGLNQSSEM